MRHPGFTHLLPFPEIVMKLCPSLAFFAAAVAASGLGVGTVGCHGASDDSAASGQALDEAGVDVPNPSGVYVANVTANGTGCPTGSWNAQIAEDGQSFLVTFQAYETTVFPGVAFSIKDCTLGINIKTPAGLSFAVTSFKHAGFAFLDKAGMTAKQTAKYYFMGNPLPARELSSTLTGPFDDVFVVSDEVAVEDQVWSPCGTERTLNAQTRLVLQNNSDKSGNGFLDTAAVAGHIDYQFHIGLAWKQCGDDADAGPPPPPPADDAGTPAPDAGSSSDDRADAGAPADPGTPPAPPGDGTTPTPPPRDGSGDTPPPTDPGAPTDGR